MADRVEHLRASLAGLDPALAEEHLSRLDSRYLERFSPLETASHVRDLAALTAADPVQVRISRTDVAAGEPPVALDCTVLAFDHPGAFSLVTGVLSSAGFHILSGDIFTYADARPPGAGGKTADAPAGALRRKRIIDTFTGTVDPEDWDEEAWAERLSGRLREVFHFLEQGVGGAARARRLVNELAADRLARHPAAVPAVLYPVSIESNCAFGAGGGPATSSRTCMRVVSEDTPFFLFTFSTALTLQGVSIEHVTIRTREARIEDEFEFVGADGAGIDEPARIDGIKLAVLLTKQFTSFLGRASDPLAALQRFESLVRDLLAQSGQGRWVRLLSDGNVLAGLAQLLGASTYLWEDFVRLQYEELLPLLAPHAAGGGFSEPLETLPDRLAQAVAGAVEGDDFARRLNAFKDREIYLFDLDHILTPGSDFLTLSRRLTTLAEIVIRAAADFAWAGLCGRFGEPRTAAGLPVRYALLGLGKLGGAALGYASDIEILLVYGDSGATAGPVEMANSEFFDRLVRELPRLVRAKREGIFHLDLRLRPFGAAGPLACSLESFCTYYAPGGPAHSYERLSLVRLRAIGGDPGLAAQVERLRDEMVYAARAVDLGELRRLRARQAQEKAPAGTANAKFSPGALVDLEYAVQVLQVMHGREDRQLRTPRIHEALDSLATIGVLASAEAGELASSYRFFRRLINGLRMLRGSAQDLFLPPVDCDEYVHLARRMGYAPEPGSTPARKLHLDFEAHSAGVRAFVERHFGRDSLPGPAPVTIADVVLSDQLPEQLRLAALAERGFRDPARAFGNLRRIAGGTEQRSLFARLAILACDMLVHRPDPDMALNNWERFLHAVPDPQAHLGLMLSQPMRLEILLKLFSASQFLSDALVREPGLLDWIAGPGVLHTPRPAAAVAGELAEISARTSDRAAWRAQLRRLRTRETLRIGARDICLGVPTERVMAELSDLADGVIAGALSRLDAGGPSVCVLAFGKLGARELNYSSDIDLLALCADPGSGASAAGLMENLRADLSTRTEEGHAYRVDLRLRPYGSAGELAFPRAALLDYYSDRAALWEVQALLKARPVAGDLALGAAFLAQVRPLLCARRSRGEVVQSIDRLRREALRSLARRILSTTDVKTGLGGLRDIEFLAQGLQLLHAHDLPVLLQGGTLAALAALGQAGVLPPASAEQLAEDYLFLRRVEHFLQIYEDRQTHSLPRDPAQLGALARLMLGGNAGMEQFLAELSRRFRRVREEYGTFTST
jgi:[glutamine synthetase] adenylyltransferase / [glutamine synthetase]-adenylyl-L-tyrosine phosphorylase